MEVLLKAINLILSGDRELLFISLTSLKFSINSLIIASGISIPLALYLGMNRFSGKKLILVLMNSLMALPTVVIGLLVYSFLSRSGPLGELGLLFTPVGIIIGQTILIVPILISMVYASVSTMNSSIIETLSTLGATPLYSYYIVFKEMKISILTALLAGFGRVIGEVGVSMMLGGNIRWYTRTITTTIALESGKGDFELALALGLVLIVISFLLNFLIHLAVNFEK
ncbi:MAG: ABC transporter permease [Spirochaetaceae bacterium]|jgi:tungstate transport system permease protein|nr:ABC transporter permease [Spirochaetaceae bacterium]